MLSDKALLANLSISCWTGRKFDKRATSTVESTHATSSDAGRYSKKLLPGAMELDAVQRHASSIRAFFYENTLPWMSDGSRILSAEHYLEFTSKFREHKQAYDNAVSDFLKEYPILREKARQKLGDLFSEHEYPSELSLQHSFACNIAFLPLPDVRDFRISISDGEKKEFIEKMQTVEREAMQECWTRLYDVVSKAATRLADSSAIFRDSLIENVHEMCALLPKLNVTGDCKLESMRQAVETCVSRINPDVCREQETARQDAASSLNDIMNKMGAFMGAV